MSPVFEAHLQSAEENGSIPANVQCALHSARMPARERHAIDGPITSREYNCGDLEKFSGLDYTLLPMQMYSIPLHNFQPNKYAREELRATNGEDASSSTGYRPSSRTTNGQVRQKRVTSSSESSSEYCPDGFPAFLKRHPQKRPCFTRQTAPRRSDEDTMPPQDHLSDIEVTFATDSAAATRANASN